MEQSLAYLREILSGHTDREELGKQVYQRLSEGEYSTELEFVRALSEDETNYLNKVLKEAIDYSNQSQDHERAQQLNEVYELLFV